MSDDRKELFHISEPAANEIRRTVKRVGFIGGVITGVSGLVMFGGGLCTHIDSCMRIVGPSAEPPASPSTMIRMLTASIIGAAVAHRASYIKVER